MGHPRAGTTMARVAIPRITVITPIEVIVVIRGIRVIVPVRPITVVIADTTMARYLGTDTRRLLARRVTRMGCSPIASTQRLVLKQHPKDARARV